MKDAGRLVYTLTPMSPEEARIFGVSEVERRSLVRMDSAKVNLVPAASTAKWFRLIGVPLDNGTKAYPAGDNVQTVEPWTPADTWEGLDHHLLNIILDDLEAGMENGQRYSAAASAKGRAAWHVVQKHAPDKTEQQCRAVIVAWGVSGTLATITYDDPVDRKPRGGLYVNAAKRPQ